jgi:hypothetical protein
MAWQQGKVTNLPWDESQWEESAKEESADKFAKEEP